MPSCGLKKALFQDHCYRRWQKFPGCRCRVVPKVWTATDRRCADYPCPCRWCAHSDAKSALYANVWINLLLAMNGLDDLRGK